MTAPAAPGGPGEAGEREVFSSHPPGPAAMPGWALHDVDTPALLLDLEAFEANMAAVHERGLQSGVRVRAHAKAHKCPEIARRQRAAGSHGVCCQKVSEAEIFVRGGINDVLITNQVVGRTKVDRLARLARSARVGVCVDDLAQVEQIGLAAARHGARVEVLIEVDIGHGRCGVADAREAVELAQAIRRHEPQLWLGGIQAFRGSAQHMRSPLERQAAVQSAVAQLRTVVAALAQQGFACRTITGGGTGTYTNEIASRFYTEVQPGSYVLMDTDYTSNLPEPGAPPLRQALHVLCTVISMRDGRAVLDGGLKAFAVDQGLPRIDIEGWSVKSLSDEHAVIVSAAGARPLVVGQKVKLVPSHCDPTVNLHDWLIVMRDDCVVETWPIEARGALF